MTTDPPDRSPSRLGRPPSRKRSPAGRPGGSRRGSADGKQPEHIGEAPDIFFAAVQTTRMPMIVTDPRQPDNPIIFANRAFLTLTGYAAEEVLGTNCRFLQGPDTDPETLAELRAAIAARREHATEILNYRKDGYSFWNALFVAPVFDDDGQLTYFFGSQLDVSRRREAEDELRQARKLEALGRLTGGIAHDFNNLLQVMSGYLELIEAGLRKPQVDLEKLQRSIANAQNAAGRASGLTQQLLAFARRQRTEGRLLDLNEVVASVRDVAQRTIGDDVAIVTDLAPDLRSCRVDAAQVDIALLNIILIARDAMQGRPERRLRIATCNVDVEREQSDRYANLAPGRYAAVAVADTGAGLPPGIAERVMDPFMTAKEDGGGTGLGLSMIYGFAKQSGATARIETEDGRGTIVRLYFPAIEGPAAPAPFQKGSTFDRPGTETILIVEDRDDVARLARIILVDLGYTVLHASDAEAALDVLGATEGIDLLFSDLVVPGRMDGVALARTARRAHPGLKVLLTTGYSDASFERTDAGGWEFDVLNKPYGRRELARKVRTILDGPTGVS